MEVQKVGLKNEAMERELREELQDLEREKIWGTHYVQPLRFVEFNLMQPPPPPYCIWCYNSGSSDSQIKDILMTSS